MRDDTIDVRQGSVRLRLRTLADTYAICRLPHDAPMPEWALKGEFTSVTRTSNELSVVCAEGQVPGGVRAKGGWRCLEVEGPLPFTLTGVLASVAVPLADAGISIFVVNTFDTDYVLVKAQDLSAALQALQRAGHEIQ